MDRELLAGSSPHIKNNSNTRNVMRDVLIALMPASIAALVFFGTKAAFLIIVTIAACVIAEHLACKAFKKESTIGDLSAAVTGLLLALNLSSEVPVWMAAVGGVFAVVVVKQLFGGLGQNFINPALAARAFMMASWPVQMTSWVSPGADAVSSATPLALIKAGGEAAGALPSIAGLFFGNIGGCIGETSALALLIGAVYLLFRRVISWETPVSFIGMVALLSWTLGGDTLFTGDFLYHILAGGLMLGAFYMATDYSTSPVAPLGRIIMGAGCGIITVVIRLYGGYPEGVSYSILLMNLVVPMIDKFLVPASFGGVKKNA